LDFSSKLIEEAVQQVSRLPGIGRKTALRLVLHLIREKEDNTVALTHALTQLRSRIRFCQLCHNISDDDACAICTNTRRDKSMVCVVEDIRDVMAIENTGQYSGLYHVLGGVISPIQGIGPSELKIESLIQRITFGTPAIKEIILALSPTLEGDTTAFYIHRKVQDSRVKVSVIARGVPIGGDLEFADEITLGRSITARTLFG
jgi:recombination protein RecR